jgi:hypothetical protein
MSAAASGTATTSDDTPVGLPGPAGKELEERMKEQGSLEPIRQIVLATRSVRQAQRRGGQSAAAMRDNFLVRLLNKSPHARMTSLI